MNIYVASSWRNQYHGGVVLQLRHLGHRVYDFKDSDGFHWREVDEAWLNWTPEQYLKGLQHPAAVRGFSRDMAAIVSCECCIMVMPCGVSASLEFGWALGAGKRCAVYVPALREPDLMVKMAHVVTDDFDVLVRWLETGK